MVGRWCGAKKSGCEKAGAGAKKSGGGAKVPVVSRKAVEGTGGTLGVEWELRGRRGGEFFSYEGGRR